MFKKTVHLISRIFYQAGVGPLLALMLVFMVLISFRWLKLPATGLFDVVVICGFILYLLTWPYIQVEKRHIHVPIIVDRLPQRVRSLLRIFTDLIGLGTCFILFWSGIRFVSKLYLYEMQVSRELLIPQFSISSMLPLSCLLLGMVIFIDLLDSITAMRKK